MPNTDSVLPAASQSQLNKISRWKNEFNYKWTECASDLYGEIGGVGGSKTKEQNKNCIACWLANDCDLLSINEPHFQSCCGRRKKHIFEETTTKITTEKAANSSLCHFVSWHGNAFFVFSFRLPMFDRRVSSSLSSIACWNVNRTSMYSTLK